MATLLDRWSYFPPAMVVFFLLLWHPIRGNEDGMLGIRMLHRFSREFSSMMKSRCHSIDGDWVAPGSPNYYKLLHQQDRRRLASTGGQILSFSSGNETMNYGELLGWLHYAVIDIGTPNASFLVALDTGSDLFWVPCECKQCAAIYDSSQQLDMPLHVYDPATSKTSRHITCLSDLCDSSETCESENDDCPYSVRYVSGNTSTSGMLVEDVIHLTSGSYRGTSDIQARIVFGCGRVQSGNFLDNGAPDGLLGLGFGAIALPNLLAKAGLIRNSFSMCFQSDGSGTLLFGDKGLTKQQETPFLLSNGTIIRYVVGLEQISVGSRTLNHEVGMIVDTGTSFTYLPKEVYSVLTEEFDAQIKQRRISFNDVPWEFCYKSSNEDVQTPSISMVFKGGGNYSVLSPLIAIYSGKGVMDGFCLAILQSEIAILGQSFMTGYQIVFDREDMKLGWSASDCYMSQKEIDLGAASPSVSSSPLTNIPFVEGPSPSQLNESPSSSSGRATGFSCTTYFDGKCFLTIILSLLLNTILVRLSSIS